MRWLPAAANGGSEAAADIWLWGGVLIGVAAVALVLMLLARRRLFHAGKGTPEAWTLQDLRQLHASGQLTDEEYANLRAQILAATGGGADTGETAGRDGKARPASD